LRFFNQQFVNLRVELITGFYSNPIIMCIIRSFTTGLLPGTWPDWKSTILLRFVFSVSFYPLIQQSQRQLKQSKNYTSF